MAVRSLKRSMLEVELEELEEEEEQEGNSPTHPQWHLNSQVSYPSSRDSVMDQVSLPPSLKVIQQVAEKPGGKD